MQNNSSVIKCFTWVASSSHCRSRALQKVNSTYSSRLLCIMFIIIHYGIICIPSAFDSKPVTTWYNEFSLSEPGIEPWFPTHKANAIPTEQPLSRFVVRPHVTKSVNCYTYARYMYMLSGEYSEDLLILTVEINLLTAE